MDQLVVRYANALTSIAKDENKLSEYKKAVQTLSDIFVSNNEIKKLLESYFVKDEEKFALIDELCGSFKLENFTNFVKLLVKKHVVYRYKDIAKEINKHINEELSIDEGIVYSVEVLSIERILEIEEAISKKLKHKVELTNRIDERLIGGVKVVVHDHVFDGSIRSKLDTLKENLNERRNG